MTAQQGLDSRVNHVEMISRAPSAGWTSTTPSADASTARQWFVASVHPGKDALAAANLQRQGFLVHLPWLVVRATRCERVRVPLFPGYLFVAFDPAHECWSPINHTLFVTHLLTGAHQRPLPVRPGVVEALIADGDTEALGARQAALEAGAAVRITAGPLAGLTGRCLLSARERVMVLLRLLGGEHRASLPRAAVAPA